MRETEFGSAKKIAFEKKTDRLISSINSYPTSFKAQFMKPSIVPRQEQKLQHEG